MAYGFVPGDIKFYFSDREEEDINAAQIILNAGREHKEKIISRTQDTILIPRKVQRKDFYEKIGSWAKKGSLLRHFLAFLVTSTKALIRCIDYLGLFMKITICWNKYTGSAIKCPILRTVCINKYTYSFTKISHFFSIHKRLLVNLLII